MRRIKKQDVGDAGRNKYVEDTEGTMHNNAL